MGLRAVVTRAFLFSLSLTLHAQGAIPKTGEAVLESMRSAYEGKWYHSLTFAQKTTMYRKDGAKQIQSWRESLRHSAQGGTQLRIEFGDPAAGNGVMYTPDSSWRFAGGKLVDSNADGNAFLPLIEGVYVQAVAKTVAELVPTHVDLNRVVAGRWRSRPVWIVGVSIREDTTSPQFWVDVATKVVVRMIVRLGSSPTPLDVHLDDYVAAGGGMLATKISMFSKGSPMQVEDYADWRADVPLTDAMFDLKSWTGKSRE